MRIVRLCGLGEGSLWALGVMTLGLGGHGGDRFELQPEDIAHRPVMAGGTTPEVRLKAPAADTHTHTHGTDILKKT